VRLAPTVALSDVVRVICPTELVVCRPLTGAQ
jgi:hypothetical protein